MQDFDKKEAVGSLFIFLSLASIVVFLPLAGAMIWRDKPLPYYLEFPPRLGGVVHARFSLAVFIALALLILACLLPFFWRAVRTVRSGWAREKPAGTKFPLW